MSENKTEKKEEKKNDPADDIAHFIIMIGFFFMTNAIIFFGGFDPDKIMSFKWMPNLYCTMVENVGVDVAQVTNVVLHIPLMFTLLLDAAIAGVVLVVFLGTATYLLVVILSVPYNWLHSLVYAIVKHFVQEENPVNENTEKQTIDDLANAVNSPPDQTKRDLEKILEEAAKEKAKGEGKLPVC